MDTTTETVQLRTRSRDGTEIATFARGDGPPLLLVHGGAGDHTKWEALRRYLEPHFTVYAMDRRGRGASGDAGDYELAREYEDVAAAVDTIADETGSTVDVYGHSYGGVCAFGAAALTSNIARLVLYEGWPPVDPEPLSASPELRARVEALQAADQHDAALETILRELVGLTDDEITGYRAQPSWRARIAAADAFAREERAFAAHPFSREEAARVTVPTLLLVGSESPAWRPQADTVAASLPDARIVVLQGQTHTADVLAPELVAGHLLEFLHEGR